MSVEYIKRLAGPYVGDGTGQKTFSFGFLIFEESDVYVAVATSSDSEPSDLQQGTDYTVSMNADQSATPGGTITLTSESGLAKDAVLVIGSAVDYTQTLDLTNYTRFAPERITTELDRIVVMIQQIVELLGRVVQVPPTSSISPSDLFFQLLNAAESAAQSAEDAAASLAACEQIRQLIEQYSWDIPHIVNSLRDVENYPYDGLFWVGGFGKVPPGQDISNRYVKANGSTTQRTLGDRFSDVLTVMDFGATGNGTTDDTAAFLSMAEACGAIVVPGRKFYLTTTTITVPIYFLPKGKLIAAPNSIITISNRINSDRQWIFDGKGTYSLNHSNENDLGEDVRQIHAIWFGVFPTPMYSQDQSERLQKACDALDNGRESEILFDIGNYYLKSQITVPRACAIVGKGTRRTVFEVSDDGFPVFKTNATACRFQGIQFETKGNGYASTNNCRVSPWIDIEHDMCEVYDVAAGQCYEGIRINGYRARVDNVIGTYSDELPDGSCTVHVLKSDATVKNVYHLTSGGAGPEAIVLIETNGENLSNVLVDNVDSVLCSSLVTLKTSANQMANIKLSNLRHGAWMGSKPNLVNLQASGSGTIRQVQLDGLYSTSYADTLFNAQTEDSGTISRVTLTNVMCAASDSCVGVSLSGSISNVYIGDTVYIHELATPVEIDGATNYYIAPSVLKNKEPTVKTIVINDDASCALDLHQTAFTGFGFLSTNGNSYAIFLLRAASSNPNILLISNSSDIETVSNTELTGTSGTDGKISLSTKDKTLYIENRLGSQQTFCITTAVSNQ